ncbi:MAG: NAD-dependent epimerase/dehydratase family protein [Simkaniaceae bacterium]|nr:NAD-dependent epimerase/dehydratase family protein [Simkaniaceae bacterium]
MKRIFITGIAGFIGFHLARFLRKRGDEVHGFDNFSPYYSVAYKKQRAAILEKEGIHLAPPQDLRNFTHFVHLAAQPGVRYSLSHPEVYADCNLKLFVDILELCRKYQLPLIYASSSSVYGLNQKIPFSEKDPVEEPANLYAATKRANELMAFSYHHLYKIPVTGLRYFTVYGPWGRPDMAYFSFAKAIKQGIPIQLYNGGNMKRDFTYIDDIVQGTVAAIDHSFPCELFNLGNHRAEELPFLISLLEKGLNKKAVIEYLPMQAGDMKETLADLSKSKRLLNYSPQTPLVEGITKFTDWIKSEAIML